MTASAQRSTNQPEICNEPNDLNSYQRAIQVTSGLLLIAIGILLVSGRMSLIAIWARQHGYYFDLPLGGAAVPNYLIAVLAGLISFLSPCVLPLVPAYVGYLSGQTVTSVIELKGN